MSASNPLVISTWSHGRAANAAAWGILSANGGALDAVETGARAVEDDPAFSSVGFGGLPDREGAVTLDACIMNHAGDCGAVACLRKVRHPISVARKVMEETPHVMLSGEGALQFALDQGFERENLLTEDVERRWREWRETSDYKPVANVEDHDTVGVLALDVSGRLAGACSTSGLAWKMSGRVGDSPIAGAGLFVDGEVGAACATGMGELAMRGLSSFLIVELMRKGTTPQEACEEAIKRVLDKQAVGDAQLGVLALDKLGQTGAYALREGFTFAMRADELDTVEEAKHQA
ncbi:MAG: N(4)-(beta-N-acetylglucosaminyl)-L-asparaginase [Opitutales bacterium]